MTMVTNSGEQQTNLLFANFNQDNTSLAAGSRSGYRLFSLSSVDKLEPIYESASEDAYIVERLFASSLVAIVNQQHPRKLKVCHFKKGTEICNYSYSGPILNCKLNRQRLVVCLEESLYIHNIRDMKVLHTIRDTPTNPAGLIALSISNENCHLAFPASNQLGEVQIFDTINLRTVIVIPAHDNRLAALAFSPAGDKLATASEKGTVIRVFGLPDGNKLFEFRRGVKRCVTITCLSFNQDATFLCSSSNTETVHVFKLEPPKERQTDDSGSWLGMFNSVVKSSAAVLPAQMTDMFTQGRSFAAAHLPSTGTKNTCAITTIQKLPRLLVVNLEGNMFIYNLDPNESGECQLVRQHRLDGASQGEGSPGDQAMGDRPLTQAGGTGSSPGAGGRGGRGEGVTQAAPSSGKPASGASGCSAAGESYAEVLRRAGGPQDLDPTQLMDTLLNSPGLIRLSGLPSWPTPPTRQPLFPVSVESPELSPEQTRLLVEVTDTDSSKIESQPYQDLEQGAVGGDLGDDHGLGGLRLDDHAEFPPMTHKND